MSKVHAVILQVPGLPGHPVIFARPDCAVPDAIRVTQGGHWVTIPLDELAKLNELAQAMREEAQHAPTDR